MEHQRNEMSISLSLFLLSVPVEHPFDDTDKAIIDENFVPIFRLRLILLGAQLDVLVYAVRCIALTEMMSGPRLLSRMDTHHKINLNMQNSHHETQITKKRNSSQRSSAENEEETFFSTF
jgi:hypothetical protein